MCVTGVALTYQKEMQWWADTRHYRAAPAAGATRAGVDHILDAVRAFDASASPTTIAWRAEADAPAAVAAGTRTLYVNPYTATVYGEGTGQGMRQFFTTMTNWHRYWRWPDESRPDRQGHHRRVEPHVPVRRAQRDVSLVAEVTDVGAGPEHHLVSRRTARQSARLQLAQHHRVLVRPAPRGRRVFRDRHLVSLVEQPRLSRHG